MGRVCYFPRRGVMTSWAICRSYLPIVAWAIFAWLPSELFAADEPFLPTAREIDKRLAAHWQAKGITPAAVADDATLLKRVTLDLIGRIPTQAEWEGRLKDGKPLADHY